MDEEGVQTSLPPSLDALEQDTIYPAPRDGPGHTWVSRSGSSHYRQGIREVQSPGNSEKP